MMYALSPARAPLRLRLLMLAAALALTTACSAAPPRSELEQFIDDVAEQHGLDRGELHRLLDGRAPLDTVIRLISAPAEAKPWTEYRPIFVNAARIDGGVAYWRAHRALLERVEREFGVPASIIVAIIGVETRYGGNTGNIPVLDALNTLGFHYPPRQRFFRSELAQYLVLCREEGWDPESIRGSYAGAMGEPQFIASSYRHYARDYDGDGRRDLFGSRPDILASVANYLSEHGWQAGAPVAAPVRADGGDHADLLKAGYEPRWSRAQLSAAGVTELPPGDHGPMSLLAFEGDPVSPFWVGYHNFYVITRYNRSALYAMAVYQLSRAIADAVARNPMAAQ